MSLSEFNCLSEYTRLYPTDFDLTCSPFFRDKTLEPEANQTVAWDYEGWVNFSIAKAVTLWTSAQFTNLGLYLRVTNIHKGE